MKKTIVWAVLLGAAAVFATEFKVNNRVPESGFSGSNTTWKYEKSVKFVKGEVPAEFLIPERQLKVHKKYSHIRGFNGDLRIQIKAPGPVKTLEWSADMTNFSDSTKRKISLSYSLDGINYVEIASQTFSGKTTLSGKVTIPANRGYLFLKMSRHLDPKDSNGKYGFVLWQNTKISVTGEYSDVKAEASSQNNHRLKEVFPTGVFWAWERTKPNADFAKMELWEFVEYSMKVLKENGYNTCWFVNISSRDDQVKILKLAEKHGLHVLTNTDLLTTFYNGISSMGQLDQLADQTVARIGHYKSLLGYVLKDEPLICDVDSCDYYYDLMRKADPSRDSVAVVMNRQTLTYLRDSKLPVVCSDVYYFAHKDSTMLPTPLGVAQDEFTNAIGSFNNSAALHGKHSWLMGQIFGDIWGRHYMKNGKMVVYPGSYLHWRMPTTAEVQWQVWEALRLGTKGMLFYVFHTYIPLTVPPEQAKTPQELKRLAKMDRAARIAAGWGNQKLTTETIELDWHGGMLEPGGKPTKQMLATANVMKLIRANEQLLLKREKAKFPVFFASDDKTNVETFVSGDRWIGIVVNRDVNNNRTVDVLLPINVKSIKDLATGKMLKISPAGKDFQKITLSLEAGTGALLEAKFYAHAGIRFTRESFDNQTIHRSMINLNAEIFHHGNYGADENRSLRLKKDGNAAEPVCAILGIRKPDTAIVTLSKNIATRSKGTVYCLVRGKLTKADIRYATVGPKGEMPNFQHLRVASKGKLQKIDSKSIKTGQFFIPAVVPNDATTLEFYLGKGDYIEDITLWFVPAPPEK